MIPTWKHTNVARRLDLAAPIIQGPFGSGLSSVDLVVAVCEAGLLGSFGVHHLAGTGIRDVARSIRARTRRAFALNLWIPLQDSDDPQLSDEEFARHCETLRPYFDELGVPLPARPARFSPRYDEQIEAVLDARPAVFSFVFGIPSRDVLAECVSRNIVTLGTATTPAEAQLLEAAGVNMIVATGFEAGGHRASFLRPPQECLTGTMSLIPQVVDAVKVPVIAAGGIGDGRGVAAALMLGAQGVQIGTAFLACDESGTNSLHREELRQAQPTQTDLTRAFSGRLARGVRNRLMDELAAGEKSFAPYPVQGWITGQLRAAAVKAGRSDLLALWSGQSAPLVRFRRAPELAAALIDETSAHLARLFQTNRSENRRD